MKTSFLRSLKLSNNGFGDILDNFRDYLNVNKGFVSFFQKGVIKNLNFAKQAQKDFARKYFQKSV